ncbi:hypothetical protein TNCV_1826611 [Trichonephila clavipes]|nr:hypothetical protein TNCV_1826611 [Trichonephila clavipes]
MTRRRVENRERSLGYPGFVTPVFTKESKPLGKKEKISRAPRDCDTRTLKKREKGIPRIRWMDKVEKWLKDLGVNRWKNIASNRSRWSRPGVTNPWHACYRVTQWNTKTH